MTDCNGSWGRYNVKQSFAYLLVVHFEPYVWWAT